MGNFDEKDTKTPTIRSREIANFLCVDSEEKAELISEIVSGDTTYEKIIKTYGHKLLEETVTDIFVGTARAVDAYGLAHLKSYLAEIVEGAQHDDGKVEYIDQVTGYRFNPEIAAFMLNEVVYWLKNASLPDLSEKEVKGLALDYVQTLSFVDESI